MKVPFIQLYTGDWLTDPSVTALSPAARGIWWDLLCVMHADGRRGVKCGNRAVLARLTRCTPDEFSAALIEWQSNNTADVSEDCNGLVTVTNRRMKREHDERESTANRVHNHRTGKAESACNGVVTPDVTALKRSILHNLEPEPESSDKASKRLMPGEGGKLTPAAVEAVQLAETVLNGEWVNDAGKWVGRAKQDAGKVFRCMADVKAAVVEGRVKTTPARMAEHNWKVFK